MHRILHGIRRSSCWPVASPLAYARLPCLLPFPILNQPFGYGDLLQNGDEAADDDLLQSGDEAADGDLLPQSGDEDEEGDLLPHSGDEDGEGIPPSQGNKPVVLCDLQPLIKGTFGNNLGIDSPKRTDAVMTSSLSVALTYVFDPGGLSCLHKDVLSACQPAAMTSNRRSTFAAAHAHLPNVGAAATFMVKKHADIQVPKGLYTTDCGDQIGCNANYAHQGCILRGTFNTTINDSEKKKGPQDAAALYDCSLWLNASNCKEDADTYFLIPLRGSNCVQWNDEDLSEDVGALKMKTKRRMTVLRLFYLMKDLLDPG